MAHRVGSYGGPLGQSKIQFSLLPYAAANILCFPCGNKRHRIVSTFTLTDKDAQINLPRAIP